MSCLDVDGWTFTAHAVDRALDMAADPADIRRALLAPTRVYPTPGDAQGRVSGRIALIVNPDLRTVITVLWDGGDATWRADLERCRDHAA